MYVILIQDHVFCDLFTFEPPNLKTVLFKETDLISRCWSKFEVNLLLNRRVMQDLIPRKIPRDLPLLLKYLKKIEGILDNIPTGINQTLLMTSVGDVLGSYLQAIVIPIANEAYYAGNVDYITVAEVHRMLNRWKWYLSTDGGTWSQECDMRKIPTKVAVLDLSLRDPVAACEELYIAAPLTPNETVNVGSQAFISESPRVAIPYFDNNLAPNAIALPFKKRNLYSLKDPKAAYILVKYYTLSMRCLSRNSNDVMAFNHYFHQWIMSKVVPHLHDQEHWYPALGAIMRVIETIKQKGLSSSNPIFVQPLGEDQDFALNANLDVNDVSASQHGGKITSYFHILNNPYAIVIVCAMVLGAITCALCCICICCYLRCRPKEKKKSLIFSDSDDNLLKNTIISLYFGLKNSITGSGLKLSSTSGEEDEVHSKKHPSEDYDKPELPYAHNTPDNYASDVSVIVTSDSDEEDSVTTTSRDLP